MISTEEVKKLAKLARVDLTDEEAVRFAKDMGEILDYVGQVKQIKSKEGNENTGLIKDVLREDEVLTESGFYTQAILENAPHVKNDFIEVKKIIEGK